MTIKKELPNFNISLKWIRLRKDMGIKLTPQQERILKNSAKKGA